MYFPYGTDNYCAFIDETGNFGFNFDTQGTSSHFIVTAIIIKKASVLETRDYVDHVRKAFFGNGEMKSSSISNNHSRRFQILAELLKKEFKILCVVVNKQKIYDGTGLSFKKTFIKYLNGFLYKELKLHYPYLEIYADTHGSDKFMKEFEKYINGIPNYSMFDDYVFQFSDSKSDPLIQLSDIISGTIALGFEIKKKCDEYRGFYSLLKDRIKVFKIWPLSYENYIVNLNAIDKSEIDNNLASYCLRLAVKFVEENKYSQDLLIKDMILVLEYLLNQLHAYNPNHYITSKELMKYINGISKAHYTDQTFKTNIIAGLRDRDVIISSSSNGYKIPVSKRELYSYANMTLGMVTPMLERLNKCRRRVLSLTDNEFDILDLDEYKKYKYFFDEEPSKGCSSNSQNLL